MHQIHLPRTILTGLLHRLDLAPAVLIVAFISFLAHVLVGDNYGFFRDELYVLAMSHHPALGYVDVPPLVPWITLIPRFLTGNALWAIHVISALVCAGTIILTGLMARLLGGTGWVQGLAALGSATALVLLAFGSIYAYDVFDEFWWTLAATILIVLLRDDRPRRWLWFVVVACLGVLTKETILFWGFALVVGLLLTSQRRLLFTRWTVFGGLIVFALFLPFLLWNAANGWASFQYWAGYSQNHSVPQSPLDFLTNQILGMNPLSLLLWGAVVLLLRTRCALSGLRVGVSHAVRALHRDWRENLFSGAGLPAVVCWWSGADRYMAGRLSPLGRGLRRAAGRDWRAAGPGGNADIATRRVYTCLWQEWQRRVAAGVRR